MYQYRQRLNIVTIAFLKLLKLHLFYTKRIVGPYKMKVDQYHDSLLSMLEVFEDAKGRRNQKSKTDRQQNCLKAKTQTKHYSQH